MIISRAPFRIALAGGGTDLPSYYSLHGGEVTSMAINRYIYVTFKRNLLEDKVRLQYLKTEVVDNANQLSHERAREVLREFDVLQRCEISSIADLPSKSGLGSSGSYLVALINCLREYRKVNLMKSDIADLACRIEMDDLKEPVGKQDQFIASYGGIQKFSIDRDGKVTVNPVLLTDDELRYFTKHCSIYYTGMQRSASKVLKSQTKDISNFAKQMQKISELGSQFLEALQSADFEKYGRLLDEHWTHKRMLSSSMTNGILDDIYLDLKKNDMVLGGKIIGAGGGGFLMLYVPKEVEKVDHYMLQRGMPRIDYSLDRDGVKTLYKEENNDILF